MNSNIKTEEDLRAGATGQEVRFRHMTGLVYTPGCQYLAEQLDAYWLLDAVASYQTAPRVRHIDLQMWILNVNLAEGTATLALQGDDDEPILTQRIAYTDFPLRKVRIWVQNRTMYLPCEH